MFARLLGARRAEQMVALNAQIPQTHSLFVLLGEGRARAFMDHAVNRLAHRAAAASGLVARTDTSSLTVLFEHADGAVQCACLLRAELRRWCANADRRLRLDLDIGLSFGAVVCRPPRYEGDTILRASTLATAASDGQILLDDAVRDALPEPMRARLQLLQSSGPEGERRAWAHACGADAAGTVPMRLTLRSPDGQLHLSFGAERPIRIGCDERADVVLRGERVSRQHAVINWRNGTFVYTDTSQHGSWIDDTQHERRVHLQHGVCALGSSGTLHLGAAPAAPSRPDLLFSVEDATD